jgi:ketosteroid isomerase-like protein
MSQENVESVRRFLDQAAENPDAVWDIFDNNVEWELGALSIPDFAPTSHGPDRVREFFRRWLSAFDDWDFEVEEVVDTRMRSPRIFISGDAGGSGVAVDQHFWQVWIMRDGKAVRVTHRFEKVDALEAAGLSE